MHQRLDCTLGQHRRQRERQVGRVPHFLGRDRHQRRQLLATEFGRRGEASPARLHELLPGLLETGRRRHFAVAPFAAGVAGAVGRGQHLFGELTGFFQHGVHQVGAAFFVARQAAHRGQFGQLVEHEAHVFDWSVVAHG